MSTGIEEPVTASETAKPFEQAAEELRVLATLLMMLRPLSPPRRAWLLKKATTFCNSGDL